MTIPVLPSCKTHSFSSGQAGKDEPVVQFVGLVVAAVVGQTGFELEAAALSHAKAALVVGKAFQMQPFCAQLYKSEFGNRIDGFCHVAVPTVGDMLPVANLKFGNFPVWIVQPAAANQGIRFLQEDEHRHILPLQVTVPIAQYRRFGPFKGKIRPVGPGEPGRKMSFRSADGLVQSRAVPWLRAANKQAFSFDLLGNVGQGRVCHSGYYEQIGRFWRIGGEVWQWGNGRLSLTFLPAKIVCCF